jgi:hypothetical protein
MLAEVATPSKRAKVIVAVHVDLVFSSAMRTLET